MTFLSDPDGCAGTLRRKSHWFKSADALPCVAAEKDSGNAVAVGMATWATGYLRPAGTPAPPPAPAVAAGPGTSERR
jgi:hypothetical protein